MKNNLEEAWQKYQEQETLEGIQSILESANMPIVEGWVEDTIADIKNLFAKKEPLNVPVNKSSCLSHIIYDPIKKLLQVTFKKSGRKYEYSNVDEPSVLQLVARGLTNSTGQEFRRVFRSNPGKYPYQEVT